MRSFQLLCMVVAICAAVTMVSAVRLRQVPPKAPVIAATAGCPPGQELVGQAPSQTCSPCVAGKYKSTFGAASCAACWPGSSTNDQTGQSTCTNCQPGSFAVYTQLNPHCTPCEAGNFAAKPGQGSCDRCQEGYFCPTSGMATQNACDVGMGTDYGANTVCTNCNAGTFAAKPGTAYPCPKCDAGDWSPPKSGACWPCDAGTYSTWPGSSACTQCEYGEFSAAGDTQCTKCPAGRYQPDVGQPSCLACPTGTTSTLGAGICSPDGSTGTTATTPTGNILVRPSSFVEMDSEFEADADSEDDAELEAELDNESEDEEGSSLIEADVPKDQRRGRTNVPPPHPPPIIPAKNGKFRPTDNTKFSKLAALHAKAAEQHSKTAHELTQHAAAKAQRKAAGGK